MQVGHVNLGLMARRTLKTLKKVNRLNYSIASDIILYIFDTAMNMHACKTTHCVQ